MTEQFAYPFWQVSYLGALMEVHLQEMPPKVSIAEASINQRLAHSDNRPDRRELLAIGDALSALRVLKRVYKLEEVQRSRDTQDKFPRPGNFALAAKV